jgi:hypothetical protein
MGLDRINRTNGIRQSQGHGRDYTRRPNIGQRRLKQWHNAFILEELNRPKKNNRDHTGPRRIIYRAKEANRVIQDQNLSFLNRIFTVEASHLQLHIVLGILAGCN